MKTLAFLFLASILFLFVGFISVPGQPPASAQPRPAPVAAAGRPSPHRLPGSAKLKKKPRPAARSRLAEAMEADDLCGARALLGQGYFSPADYYLIMKSVGAPPALQELFSPEGPLYGSLAADPARFHSDLARLVFALRLGGLETFSKTEPNTALRKRARALLLALGEKEPGNAAYPYFRLAVEKALSFPAEELRKTLAAAADADRFDTLLFSSIRTFEPLRWQSATHHYLLTELLDRLGGLMSSYPSYQGIRDLSASPEEKERLGELMMEEGRRARRSHYFCEYSTTEYVLGNRLTKGKEPYFTELSGAREQEDFPLWRPYLDEKNCRRAAYDDYLRLMRAYL